MLIRKIKELRKFKIQTIDFLIEKSYNQIVKAQKTLKSKIDSQS